MNEVASAQATSAPGSTSGPSSIAQPAPTLLDVRPAHPPGRRSRKARGYADRIRELHAQGYSIEQIREALAEAGIFVSWSTVQREAARPCVAQGRAASSHRDAFALPVARASPPAAGPSDASQLSADVRGKDFAEAFMNSRVSNTLLRKDQR